ncbi:MAG: ABC transporter ATP-binding protein/permease [Clostridiales bacterium]|nr:ABC transporter ATP-binding protein/permease [Clostridiales bacterium]
MSYYIKKFWKMNLLAIIFQILMYIFNACVRLILMRELQGVIQGDIRRFLLWTLAEVGGWALYFVCYGLHTCFRSRAILRMNNAVRRDLAVTLMCKSHMDYHTQDTGTYLSWFTGGVEQIEDSAWDSFFALTGCIAQIVTGLVALASLHWSLVLVSLFSAVLMIAAPKLFEQQLERLGSSCAQAHGSASAKLKDLLAGYDVLSAFNRGPRFLTDIDKAGQEIEAPRYRKACRQGMIYSGTGLVNLVAQTVVTCAIALLSIKGVIIQTALLGGSGLCSDIAEGLNELSAHRLSFASARPYFARVTDHERDEAHLTEQAPVAALENIYIENLSFCYGDKPVLRDLTLQFRKGGKYAIIGPSGCGKSTLLKILLGWLPDYVGNIRFDGKDARDFTTEQLKQQMSYIEQNVFLFNSTIRDNITLGEKFTNEQMENALRDSALSGDLAAMPDGLDTVVGEDGSNLSGGQKQRVAIARALIHNRTILLVDEGTSALDYKNADIVEKSLLSNQDLTLILVSHHLTPERKEQFTGVYDLQPLTT